MKGKQKLSRRMLGRVEQVLVGTKAWRNAEETLKSPRALVQRMGEEKAKGELVEMGRK